MRKAKEYWEIYRADILMMCVPGIIFGSLCLYRLFNGGEFSGDEFYTLEDTLGYVYTGRKLKWDFITGQVTDIGVKITPYYFILSIWIRLFGLTPFSTRMLSSLFGILAVFSFYYTAGKLTGSRVWTFISAILLATNATMLSISVSTRGYALLFLLNIWIFYLIYLALNYEWKREPHNRFGQFIGRYLGFGYHYAAAALVFIYLAFRIRVFEFLYLIGICFYIVIKAVRTKEKKYIIAGSILWGSIAVFALAAGFHLERYLSVFQVFAVNLRNYIVPGFHSPEYWVDLAHIFRIFPVTGIGVILACICLYRKTAAVGAKEKDVITYLFTIAFFAALAFSTIVDWAHVDKYLFAVYPAAILVIVSGFYLFFGSREDRCRGYLYGILSCCLAANVLGIWTEVRAGEKDYTEDYAEAYEKVAEYVNGAPVFITGTRLRGYYANDLLGGYEWQPMTEKGLAPDISHLEELSGIGREHPEGIITCEEVRWYHFRNSFWQLLNLDAFEKITGTGLDETHVSNWAYHLCYPTGGAISEGDRTTVLFGFNYGGAIHIDEEEDRTVVELELNGSAPEPAFLCVKINQYYAGEKRQRYVQLVLEPNGQPVQYYRIELENGTRPDKSVIDDTYCIYSDGKEPERYEDCYIL